jgi:hypothetical protein
MHRALQYAAWAIGLWLDVRVISVQLRGSYREYPFVFAYVVSLLVSTIAEIGLQGAPQTVRDFYYWMDEAILDVLVFCVVIAFIDQAARYSGQKTIGRRWLILASVLILAISVAIHRSSNFNLQMTLISRDLNICAVILDLILWSLLVAARRPDRCLMLLSGGLGLQLTGAIMGEQLRQFSRHLVMTGALLEMTTGLLGVYIWWLALRAQKKVGPEGPTRR